MEIILTVLYLSLQYYVVWVIGQSVDEQTKMKYEIFQHYQKKKNASFWDPEYNPKHGYEPYWVDGHWVFQTPTLKEGETTTPMPQVCGDECSYLYQPIREVCGREIADTYVSGCLYMGFLHRCYNDDMDDHIYGYKTFKTYCEFLDVQCRGAEEDKHWMFVHVGACTQDQDTVIREIRDSNWILNRMNNIYLPLLNQTAHDRNLVPFV